MKLFLRFLLGSALCFLSILTYGQSRTIPADNSFSSATRFPFGTNFGYEYFRAYYTSAEAGPAGGTIYSLSWYMNSSNNPGNTPVQIRLGATTDSILTPTNQFYTEANTSLAFEGTLAPSFFAGTGRWLRIVLTTPFVLPAGSNLMVLVKTSQGTTGNEASLAKSIRQLNTGDMTLGPWRAMFWNNNATPPALGSVGTFTIIRPNIKIGYSPVVATDVGIESIISPTTFCGASTPISIRVENTGTSASAPFSVFYSFNNGPAISSLISGGLPANGSAVVVSFPNQTLSGNGPFVFKFWTNLASDLNANNDTLTRIVSRPLGFAPLTFTGYNGDNLSNVASGWSEAQGVSVPSGTTSNWEASSLVAFGSVGATKFMFNTDPSFDKQWIVGPSFVANASSAIRLRVSKTSGTGAPGGSTSASLGDDSLKIMVSTNCGSSWRCVSSVTTLDNLTHVYKTITLPLMATTGQEIRVALVSSAGNSSTGLSYNLNIDDVTFVSVVNADITPIAILNPAIACGLSASTAITVQFFNHGLQAQTNIPVFYSVNNQTAVAGILPSIASNASANFTFGTAANMSISNPVNLRVWSGLSTDIITSNDTIKRNYTLLSAINKVDFAGFGFENLPLITNNQWQEHGGESLNNIEPNNNSPWRTSNMEMPLAAVYPGAATIYLTGNSTRAWLASTAFRLMPNANFRFRAAISTLQGGLSGGLGSDDSLNVMISTNCGRSWQVFSSLLASNGLNNQYQSFTLPLNQFAGQDIRIALKATVGNINNSEFYYLTVDDLEIVYISGVDLVVQSLVNPSANACGLSSSAPITMRIRNIGIAAATGLVASYRINNGPIVSETVSASIAPNAILDYNFTTPANLSNAGTYSINLWTSHPQDLVLSNDTLKNQMITNIAQISSYPYFESFETSNGTWLAGGQNMTWALGTPAKSNLTVAGHGTKAWLTGGLGIQGYAYDEISHVTSPCFNFSGLARPSLEMRVWWKCEAAYDGMAVQYSTNNGQTWVLADNSNGGLNGYNNVGGLVGLFPIEPSGKGWTGDFPFSSPPSSEVWKTTRFSLPELAGQTQVRFRVVFGSDGSAQREGTGFDAVRIYEAPAKNFALTQVFSPTSCGISDTMRVRVNVRNEGLAKQGNFSISYRIAAQPIQTAVFADSLNPGQTRTFTLPLHSGSYSAGAFNMKAWVSLAGDADAINDSVTNHLAIFVGDGLANTNFSGFNGSNIATVFPGWREGRGAGSPSGDESQWTFGNTVQTAFYGPTASINLWNGNPNAWLITRPFKIVQNGILEYDLGLSNSSWQAITPAIMGATHKLEVMISTDCGTSWALVHTITKDSVLSLAMIRKQISLNTYAGNVVQLAFFASVGSSPDGANIMLHIDNVQVGPGQLKDVGVLSIISPSGNCNLSSNQTISVRVNNFGFSSQINIPIRYSINGSAPITHTIAGPLAAGAQTTVSFPAPINLSMAGNYLIKVWTNLSGDIITTNDTARTSITRFSATTPIVNFNGFNGSNLSVSAPFWQEGTGTNIPVIGNSAWISATLATNTVAKISLSGSTPRAWIVSPAIKVFGQPQLVFKAALRTLAGNAAGTFGSDDSVSVMVSTNCGNSWASVLVFRAGQTGTPALTANLADYTLNLPAVYANREILVAFRASDGIITSPGADFLLDDIQIRNNTSIDIGVSAITPLSFVRATTTNLSVRVTNYGTAASPTSAITTRYGSDNYTTPIPAIAAGQSINVNPGSLSPFVAGTFSAEAYTLLTTDQDIRNDTIRASYTVVEPTSSSSAKPNLAAFQIYPNPGKTRFSIRVADDWKATNAEIIVRDLSGKIVFKADKLVGGLITTDLELEGLAAGTYLVSLTSSHAHWHSKLVISK